MGARGRVKRLGERVRIRFYGDAEAELRILAAMWSTSVPHVVRILVDEALRQRKLDKDGLTTMSRKIDVSDPDNLSDDDREYLAQRYGLANEADAVEVLAVRQGRYEMKQDQIEQQIAEDGSLTPEEAAYRKRVGLDR